MIADDTRLQSLSRSQLRHILVSLEDDDRAFNFRDVLDPWWCFRRGAEFVTKGREGRMKARQFNKPCPWKTRDLLPRFDFLSKGAAEILARGESARIVDRKSHSDDDRIVIDHSVPMARISQEIWERRGKWDVYSLCDFLAANFRRAAISFHEDKRMNGLGLKQGMPAHWRVGDSPFERYEAAAIERFD